MNIQQIVEILEADIEVTKADFSSQDCSFCADHAPKVARNRFIINSLKKQKAVKVKAAIFDKNLNAISGNCPVCENLAENRLSKKNKTWCSNCGQALSWKA